MKKFYVSDENVLNDYEKAYGVISYSRLMDRYIRNMVLCNNIADDPTLQDEIYELWSECFYELDDETQKEYDDDWTAYYEGTEIFQYYITDMTSWDYEALCEYGYKDSIVYSTTLDCYVLLVSHWGTSWDYVFTGIKWTTNYKEA